MPTIILLDTSVSMLRPFPSGENGDTVSLMQLAHSGINHYLDFLSTHENMEFVALMTFYATCKTIVNFTRDFNLIRSKLTIIEESDAAHVVRGVEGAIKLVLTEWGTSIPCNIVLFTDESSADGKIMSSMLPLPFPGKLHVIVMTSPSAPARAFFQRLVEMARPTLPFGQVLYPEPGPTKCIGPLVKKLVENIYSTYSGLLKCGNLTAPIGLYPAPQPHKKNIAGETITTPFSETLEVFGFIDFQNLASPKSVSRHLVTPLPSGKQEKVKTEGDGGEETDEGRIPSFCVLLHGALKVENVAALCTVGEDWFGVLYSWAEIGQKKSNLMLTVFEPGVDAVPWLGDLNYLKVMEEFPVIATTTTADPPSFPVQPTKKRSYSSNANTIWIRNSSLQTDIQKLLRHAKKMPDKTQQFYRELNKLRKAAICFGFNEMLVGLADILERECQNLPPGTHPECAIQLDNACEMLRSTSVRDPNVTIVPIGTRYQMEHDH